jgi:uncharacterized protein YciI
MKALAAALLLIPTLVHAESPPPAATPAPAAAKPPEMEPLQLVLLRRGPTWSAESTPAVEQLQRDHLAFLRKLAESGKMVLAGPFAKQEDPRLRGMCLFKVATPEEARSLIEGDPMVKSGRLEAQVMTWFVEKGYVAFPKAPPVKASAN